MPTLARAVRVVIVFDDAFIPLDKTNEVKRIAREIVARLGPEDVAAVTFTDSGRRQDITHDRSLLLKAIDSVVPHMSRRNDPPLACTYRGKSRSKAACVIDTLTTASQALLDAPEGRKTFVYISAGFAFSGSSAAMRTSQYFEEVLSIQAALQNLQRANVNVYAIDPSAAAYPSVVAPLDKAIQNSMPGGDLALRTTVAPFAIPGQKNAALVVATLLRDPLSSGAQTIEVATRALDGDCGDCKKLPSSRQVVTFSPRAGQTARAEVLSVSASHRGTTRFASRQR